MSLPPPPAATVEVETVVVRLRRHGRRLLLPLLVLLATAGAAGYWVGSFPEPWMNLAAACGAAAVALVLGVGPVLAWLATRVTITTRRVIVRRGFFVRHRSELQLARVREVRARRGLVQRMFGSGDVELVVGVEAPAVLRDVPGPVAVVDALHELIARDYARETAGMVAATGLPGLPGLPAVPGATGATGGLPPTSLPPAR
ncbi:MAG: PH domain-containing protein [Candidatus Leucobacter sulfamidivorax]|nr:PH domain-containing protein [Candidatus Leucobacter sulfamidivorax]